jgi:hypothetical protein
MEAAMGLYRVTWEIEIEDADSATDAAEQAFCMMQDPDTTATVFTVVDPEGRRWAIDLDFGNQRVVTTDPARNTVAVNL